MSNVMNSAMHADVMARLATDFEFKKTSGNWLQGGKCPSCGKTELFANKNNPWVIKCGRFEQCGTELLVKNIYPEIFDNWGDRYPATAEYPNAAADAYLREARGFNLDLIAGQYTQASYYDNKLKIGSTTVRFTISVDIYWECLIDQPKRFNGKDSHFNFGAKYYGMAWCPPIDIPDDEIWIVQDIFNSIALMHHGIYAASAMSSSNYPHLFLTAAIEKCEAAGKPRPKLVWALDDGKSGATYAKKFNDRAIKEGWQSSCVIIRGRGRHKPDWNDQHMADRLDPEDIEEYRYWGALLTAKSAADKSLIMYKRKKWTMFFFDYDNRLYWFEYDIAKYNAAEEKLTKEKSGNGISMEEIRQQALEDSRTIKEIANCVPTALYYQANELTDESWYYVRIDFPHDGPAIKNTFTGAQLTSSAEFKKRLLSMAPGALYTGNAMHLDLWLQKQMFGIKTVKTIDYIGYTKEHGAWVFDDIAIKDGKAYELNDEDFFDIGKLAVKSLNKSVALAINPDTKDYDPEWSRLVWQCFGPKGIVALAFWLGSLFAEQIRAQFESFPFIEIVGEPNSGKSTLIEFLWKLVGRSDYEGFDPQKATVAARARNFAQVSNLPIVLIESDRDSGDDKGGPKQKGFDWDELKTAFNGRSVRSTGVKNTGNDTREPPFRGAIVISQNATVVASDAFMQRLMHVWLEAKQPTEESRAYFKKLASYPVKKCSQFVLMATKAEAAIMATMAERHPIYVQILDDNPQIKQQRIVHNHAQLMALVDALRHVVKFSDEAYVAVLNEITEMAIARQAAINDDHPRIQEFWELYDFIESKNDDAPVLNHSREPTEIAINLNDFVAKADAFRQQIPDMREIKKLLRTSRERRFKEANATINSVIHSRTVKAWIFEKPSSK